MAKKRKKPLQRGPKGGKKHTPGRGHDHKSRVRKDKKRKRKAEQRHAERADRAKEQWEVWDGLTDEQKKMLPELKPDLPRPEDDTQGQ